MKKIKEFFKKNQTEIKFGTVIGVMTVISYIIGQNRGYESAIDSFDNLDITLYANNGDDTQEIELRRIKNEE